MVCVDKRKLLSCTRLNAWQDLAAIGVVLLALLLILAACLQMACDLCAPLTFATVQRTEGGQWPRWQNCRNCSTPLKHFVCTREEDWSIS